MKQWVEMIVLLAIFAISASADASERHRVHDRVDWKATFVSVQGEPCASIVLEGTFLDLKRWFNGNPRPNSDGSWTIVAKACNGALLFEDGGDELDILIAKQNRDEFQVMMNGAHGTYFYSFKRASKLDRFHEPDPVVGNCKNRERTVVGMTGDGSLTLPAELGGGVLKTDSASYRRAHRNVKRNHAETGLCP